MLFVLLIRMWSYCRPATDAGPLSLGRRCWAAADADYGIGCRGWALGQARAHVVDDGVTREDFPVTRVVAT